MTQLIALMIHAADPAAARAWYQNAFRDAIHVQAIPGLETLRLGGVQLEFVAADDKVASGAAGTVPYWEVPDFTSVLAWFQSQGAVLYRGPMAIENDRVMCQVRDPWGNCIGIRGAESRA